MNKCREFRTTIECNLNILMQHAHEIVQTEPNLVANTIQGSSLAPTHDNPINLKASEMFSACLRGL